MTDIAGERRKLTDQGLLIGRRETWGARENYSSDRACDVPARALFLHISVTELASDEHAGMRTIERIGQDRFGIGCSYNAAAFPSGRLYEGQPLTRRGAHTVNTFERSTCPTHGGSLTAPSWNNNINARALVLPQMVDDPVTDLQIDAAARWAAAQIRAGLVVAGARWHGHRCVTAKECPGDDGYRRVPELQRLTDHYVANGLVPSPTPEDPMPLPAIMVASGQTQAYYVDGNVKRKIVSGVVADYLTGASGPQLPEYTGVPSAVLSLWPTVAVDANGIGRDASTEALAAVNAVAAQVAGVATALQGVAATVGDDATAAQVSALAGQLSTAVQSLTALESDDASSSEVAEVRQLVQDVHDAVVSTP